MSVVYITFDRREDEAAGLVQLARHSQVDALPNGIYAVRREALKWLDDTGLPYRLAPESEVMASRFPRS